MIPVLRRFLLLSGALMPAALSLGLNACLTDDMDNVPVTGDTTIVIDPFPKPQGPKVIPLEKDFRSTFRYVEFDSAGQPLLRPSTLTLYVSRRKDDLWTYAFEDSTQGYLIRYLATANPDSAGIWIAGTFRDTNNYLDTLPTRWLPQDPDTGTAWHVGKGRTMRLTDKFADYYTEVILPWDTAAAPISHDFQKHTAYRFREVAGDTVTVYHFRPGLGCLGFERSARGRLLASGTLISIYSLSLRIR